MAITLETKGKVADIYRIDGVESLKIHNRTDRFSIGDINFPGTVKHKGVVLNQMSLKWKLLLEEKIKNDLFSQSAEVLMSYGVPSNFIGSVVLVEDCIPIPLECIVRGYYIPESKSWNPYKETGSMYGNKLPAGLKESEKLPHPIYTPSTKAAPGEHDRNISFEETFDIIREFLRAKIDLSVDADIELKAQEIADELKRLSLTAYEFAHKYAFERGIILADAKLEFGLLKDYNDESFSVVLIDEVFTPDSSRFWDAEKYEVGKPQPSMDKQFIRRYVYQTLGWDGKSDPPTIPDKVLDKQSEIYCDIYFRLFGQDIVELTSQIAQEIKAVEDKKII